MKFIIKMIVFISMIYIFLQLSINYNSHVIILLANTRIDLSLITMLGFILFFYIALYFIISIINSIYSIPNDFKGFITKRNAKKVVTLQEELLMAYLTNDYDKAYDLAQQYFQYKNNIQDNLFVLSLMLMAGAHIKDIDILRQ